MNKRKGVRVAIMRNKGKKRKGRGKKRREEGYFWLKLLKKARQFLLTQILHIYLTVNVREG